MDYNKRVYERKRWEELLGHESNPAAMNQTKVSFPRFTGDDLRGWLYRSESFFERNGTPWDRKVWVAAVHLEGQALQWHQVYMLKRMTRETPRWEEYVQALHSRFGVTAFEDSRAERVTWRQSDEREFDSLAAWKQSAHSQQNTNLKQSQESTYTTKEDEIPNDVIEEDKPRTDLQLSLGDLTGDVQELRCNTMRVIEQITPVFVIVANGERSVCREVCRGFSWGIQDHKISSDLFLLRLGGYDRVPGVEWLTTLGDIGWSFQKFAMGFTYEGRANFLRGSTEFKREGIGVHAAAAWLGAEKISRRTFSNSEAATPIQAAYHGYGTRRWHKLQKLMQMVGVQQGAGKEYICVTRLHSAIDDVAKVSCALETLTGAVLQRSPLIFAVKRQLRIRTIYENKLLEFDKDNHLVVFWISCEAIKTSRESSWMLENRVPHMLDNDYTPYSAVDIFVKGLGSVSGEASARNVPLCVAIAAYPQFLSSSAAGFGRGDDARVVKVYGKLTGVSVDGKLPMLKKNVVLSSLPSESPQEPIEDIHMLNQNSSKTLVVLDDDPTGTQTVHDIEVLIEWSGQSLVGQFQKRPLCVFILTNPSALSSEKGQCSKRGNLQTNVAVSILISYKGLFMKDSAVNAVCYGAQQLHSGKIGSITQRNVDLRAADVKVKETNDGLIGWQVMVLGCFSQYSSISVSSRFPVGDLTLKATDKNFLEDKETEEGSIDTWRLSMGHMSRVGFK